MNNKIEKWVNEWAVEDNDEHYREINTQVNFLSANLFHDYLPSQNKALSFHTRLENWLSNLADKEQKKTLFKLLPYIFYLGNKEFNNLYKVAYNEIIARWIIDVDKINFNNLLDAHLKLKNGLNKCWICPITDSLNINPFYKVNFIPGNDWNEWRPQWYNIEAPGNNMWENYANYIKRNNIKKLVLIEDFVGSGSQIEEAIEFVAKLNLGIDILILPIVICPDGIDRFEKLQRKYSSITYKAVLELSDSCFIISNPKYNYPYELNNIKNLIETVYLLTSGGVLEGNEKPYSPYGFRSTGGLIVMYSNTPDNTLPVIHWESKSWKPLFIRHSRN